MKSLTHFLAFLFFLGVQFASPEPPSLSAEDEMTFVPDEIASMNVEHGNGGVVGYHNKLYVWAGNTTRDRTAVLEIYDPLTHSWTLGASFPDSEGRSGIGEFVLRGQLYSIGGEKTTIGGVFTRTVHTYDPITDSWTQLNDFPTNIWDPLSTTCAGKAYVLGGRHGYGRTYPEVYAYEQESDTWIRRADMPVSVMTAGVTCHDDKLYVFGGNHAISEPEFETVKYVQIYDPSTDTWSHGRDMPERLRTAAALTYDGCIYLFAESVFDEDEGGWVPNEYVYRYTPESDEWEAIPFSPSIKISYGNPIGEISGYAYFTDTYEDGVVSKRAFRMTLPERFVRGDANRDGRVNISDAVYVACYLFTGYECKSADAMDVTDDGSIGVADSVYLLNYLFTGGPHPSAPFPDAGFDPSGDDLSCGGE